MCKSYHSAREYACLIEALIVIMSCTERLPSLEGRPRRECCRFYP